MFLIDGVDFTFTEYNIFKRSYSVKNTPEINSPNVSTYVYTYVDIHCAYMCTYIELRDTHINKATKLFFLKRIFLINHNTHTDWGNS